VNDIGVLWAGWRCSSERFRLRGGAIERTKGGMGFGEGFGKSRAKTWAQGGAVFVVHHGGTAPRHSSGELYFVVEKIEADGA
jgi:hypothetical protein